jgi:ribosomal protein S8
VPPLEEWVLAQRFESEAILNVLEQKGFIRKAEVLDGVKRLREKAAKVH